MTNIHTITTTASIEDLLYSHCASLARWKAAVEAREHPCRDLLDACIVVDRDDVLATKAALEKLLAEGEWEKWDDDELLIGGVVSVFKEYLAGRR